MRPGGERLLCERYPVERTLPPKRDLGSQEVAGDIPACGVSPPRSGDALLNCRHVGELNVRAVIVAGEGNGERI